MLVFNLNAQSGFNTISRNEFSILNVRSNLKSTSIRKVSEIKSCKAAELQLGRNYSSKNKVFEASKENYNKMVYDDGLELSIPENQRLDLSFRITSDKYVLKLANGQTVKVGMKGSELEAIFPKSYSSRSTISNVKDKIGKVGFLVYFSRVVDGNIQVEDSRIVFVLSKENGVLEEFYTYEPL